VKHPIALCAAAVTLVLSAPFALRAQGVPQPYPPDYPSPYSATSAGLPPYEIVTIVRSSGFDPVSRPQRQGALFVVRAFDESGRLMQVFVDPRRALVVRVVPAMPREALVPPSAVPSGRGAADGSADPGSRRSDLPEGADAGPGGSPLRAGPKPAARSTASAPAATQGPPLPRPRPKTASLAPPEPASPRSSMMEAAAPTPQPTPSAPVADAAPGAGTAPPLVEVDE
jgi:hypothetical protein